VSSLVNQDMGYPSVSFSQEGGATRNKQDFIGDLPSLGKMDLTSHLLELHRGVCGHITDRAWDSSWTPHS